MIEEIQRRSVVLDTTLRPVVLETPVVSWTNPTRRSSRIKLKLENEQATGSFKIRGALAKLHDLGDNDGVTVITASTGNHALALTHAGRSHGVAVHAFVSATTSSHKLDKLRAEGAVVEIAGDDPVEAETAARVAANVRQVPYVSPYNDIAVISGQATIAHELVRQVAEAPDAVVVAVGGGGLISGIASILSSAWPATRIVAAYPERSPALAAAVRVGHVVATRTRPTLSDSTGGGIEPGAITVPLCTQLVHEWVPVDESEIAATMRRVANSADMRIEGAAAVAVHVAAIQSGTALAIVCGGNIDQATAAAIFE